MVFEFSGRKGMGLLAAFAEAIGSRVEDGYVHFPAHIGEGYFRGLDLDPQLRMMIRRYDLHEDLTIRRTAMEDGDQVIVLAFHNFFPEEDRNDPSRTPERLPFVQVTTAGIDYEDFFPVHTRVSAVIITIHRELLQSLLRPAGNDPLLTAVLSGKPFLYESFFSAAMHDAVAQLFRSGVAERLQHLYFRVRAEELIYLFFAELVKREGTAHYPFRMADMKQIYRIRDLLGADLSRPPVLSALARTAHMSESKLKKLFVQVFGTSIYPYYQMLRMKEAARLLREEGLSVSEAGYRLGFANLSHFSRLFARHMGMKPKQYSKR